MDQNGKSWDAVVGRGSWGVYTLLFSPVGWTGQTREIQIDATSFEEALLGLDELDEAALWALLDDATPKQ